MSKIDGIKYYESLPKETQKLITNVDTVENPKLNYTK